METHIEWGNRPAGIRPLPAVSGHLALDFANTVDDPEGPEAYDHVADYSGLLGWALDQGLLEEEAAVALRETAETHPARATSAVRRAAALRAALNETFGALVEDRSPRAGWEQLRDFAAEALAAATLERTDDERPILSWSSAALDSPLFPVAAAAHQLLLAPEVRRLKRCAGCPWLFLDSSKNGSRRWCSMQDCGTHAKIQRYVKKRAEQRGPATGARR
jgi:predicted RNA-binding Zn ribbon-like protein